MLRVVDQEQLDAAALGSEQVVVRGKSLERGTDKFGRSERGHRGLRSRHSDGGAQQHDLLVGLREPARGQPLGTPGKPADALQRKRIHATLGAARHQIA